MRFSKILLVCLGSAWFAGLPGKPAPTPANSGSGTSGAVLADGGEPLPRPPLVADGGEPLPRPPLIADGGAPLPPPLLADGGEPLPRPPMANSSAS